MRDAVMRCVCAAIAILIAVAPVGAVTKWKNIQPGDSRRADVDRSLGAPVQAVTASQLEYAPQQGTGKIVVEYRADSGVVDRIDVYFVKPIGRTALITSFNLAGIPGGKKPDADGRLAEYFAATASMAFFYSGREETDGVARVSFFSRELFDRLNGAMPTAPTNPVSDWKTQKNTFDPSACTDIYHWAQSEQDVAKRTKDVARRQLMLEILVASQKGDCARARSQAESYRQRYGGRE